MIGAWVTKGVAHPTELPHFPVAVQSLHLSFNGEKVSRGGYKNISSDKWAVSAAPTFETQRHTDLLVSQPRTESLRWGANKATSVC